MTEPGGLDDLLAWLSESGLAAPALPAELASAIHRIGPTLWATDLDVACRRDPAAFLEAALDGSLAAGLLVGWSGRGLTSNFFHLRLADDALVLIIVLPLNNPVDEGDAGAATVSSVLTAVGRLHAAAVEARDAGRISGRPVVVWDWPHLDSRFTLTGSHPLQWRAVGGQRLIDEVIDAVSTATRTAGRDAS